jgi:hypothetical protein
MKNVSIIDPRTVRDISPSVLAAQGKPRIMPARFYKETTAGERALFGLRHGIYGLPTEELIAWVRERIGGRSAIEIGAGHGGFAEALGIPATDNWQQADPAIAGHYAMVQQPVVTYGEHVEKLDAAAAVAKHKPQVVVATWVTHRYRPERHAAGGNQDGVNEEALIKSCETYIFIGNRSVHAGKSIWSLPHEIIEPDWVFSRAINGSPDFIAVWERNGR